MSPLKSIFAFLIAIPLCLSVAGCGESHSRLGVSGKVTFKGEPLSKGRVIFADNAGIAVATGLITSGGNYRLEQVQGKGIEPGSYKVRIESWNQEPGQLLPSGGFAKGDSIIPQRYNSAKDSGLTAEVSSSKRTFDFELVE